MKMLILAVMICGQVWGQAPTPEMPTRLDQAELQNKFISSVRDVQIEQTLGNSSEFRECMRAPGAAFRPDMDATAREDAAKVASECLKRKLAGKSKDDIESLERNLNLNGFGLIQSRTLKDITGYLANKMYKIMSGVDLEERNIAKLIKSQKFGTKKLLDQKDFIKLYKSQLQKNTLYEISRYCFEKFRKETSAATETTFKDHWDNFTPPFTDTGSPKFSIDATSEQALYQGFVEGLGMRTTSDTQRLEDFYGTCYKQIMPLCSAFERTQTSNNSGVPDMAKGANSCLLKAKLLNLRKSIVEAEKIVEQFDSAAFRSGPDSGINVGNLNSFQASASGEDSLDALTSTSSKDILTGGLDDSLKKKQEECAKTPDIANCDEFLIVDDSLNKAEFDTNVALSLKRDMEVAKIKSLQGDQPGLLKYLEEKGYVDILRDYQDPNRSPTFNLEERINQLFEAQRVATIAGLRNNVGARQKSENEIGDGDQPRQNLIRDNAQESQNERARLAQVVFFNNVVTSTIGLINKNTGKELGRNVYGASLEISNLSGEGTTVNPDLFSGLQQNVTENPSQVGANDGLTGTEFLDIILGVETPAAPVD